MTRSTPYSKRKIAVIDIRGKGYRHLREKVSTSQGNRVDISGKTIDIRGKRYRHLGEEVSTSQGSRIDIWGKTIDIWGKSNKLSTPSEAVTIQGVRGKISGSRVFPNT
jgi:hypothetical protein